MALNKEFPQVDREIYFDSPKSLLHLQPGEEVIRQYSHVEDTKGGSNETGILRISNLRVVWIFTGMESNNLSIGLNCIKDVIVRWTNSVAKGKMQSLFISTAYEKKRYEFIFTALTSEGADMVVVTQSVHKAYTSSQAYRDLRLRGSIMKDDELQLLNKETIISSQHGISNLGNTEQNIGMLYTTNVRVVWCADNLPNLNVSIPFIMIKNVKVNTEEDPPTLVIETSRYAGSHVFGFQAESSGPVQQLCQEIQKLRSLVMEHPIYGVEVTLDQVTLKPEPPPVLQVRPDFVLKKDETRDVFSQYAADSNQTSDRPPVFSPSLGLAVESLPDGYTVESVWGDLVTTAKMAMELG